MSHARTANLPGAIELGLADNILDTAARHVAHGGCTPAALSVIGHEPGLSIDFLARVLAMSHPGAVRLVNHLEADGLVRRRPSKEGCIIALHLTVSGQKLRVNTVTNYKRKFYVDLESSSGQTHHILAVPAVFIVDRGGNIILFVLIQITKCG